MKKYVSILLIIIMISSFAACSVQDEKSVPTQVNVTDTPAPEVTDIPTAAPTDVPTQAPTAAPTDTPVPTEEPYKEYIDKAWELAQEAAKKYGLEVKRDVYIFSPPELSEAVVKFLFSEDDERHGIHVNIMEDSMEYSACVIEPVIPDDTNKYNSDYNSVRQQQYTVTKAELERNGYHLNGDENDYKTVARYAGDRMAELLKSLPEGNSFRCLDARVVEVCEDEMGAVPDPTILHLRFAIVPEDVACYAYMFSIATNMLFIDSQHPELWLWSNLEDYAVNVYLDENGDTFNIRIWLEPWK